MMTALRPSAIVPPGFRVDQVFIDGDNEHRGASDRRYRTMSGLRFGFGTHSQSLPKTPRGFAVRGAIGPHFPHGATFPLPHGVVS